MTEDFRSDRMPSPEGKGIARRGWEAYAKAVNKRLIPAAQPLIRKLSAAKTADLMGFWLAWHLEGGFEGLERGGVSRATIYRRISYFRKVTGKHPDEFQLAGVTLDIAAYQESKKGQSQD